VLALDLRLGLPTFTDPPLGGMLTAS